MLEYISLLRGINVSGKMIKMDQLKSLYESLGLSEVTTYIKSGNVLFNVKNQDPPELKSKLQDQILSNLGFEVKVLIRTRAELQEIIDNNPFIKAGRTEFDQMHVTLLEEKPAAEVLNSLTSLPATKDQFRVVNREIYLLCPEGYGRTVFSNNFFEKKLKVPATTRNWNTIKKLYEIASI